MSEKVSVIICTYNRAKFIKSSLSHLTKQTLANDQYEIIVVNNNCTDDTGKLVNKFILDNPECNISQFMETNQGLSFARNRGLKEAKHELICYIDDDGNAEVGYLEKIVKIFSENPEYVGVGGKVIPVYEEVEPEWYNPFLRMMVTAIDFGDKPFKCRGKKYPAGCSMIYKKTILELAGGFNNDLKWRADDKYIFHAVSKISTEIYYRPELTVEHHIDAARTTDENFDRLSGLLGSEERLRIKGKKRWAYPFKLIEFVFKYFASIAIAIYYILTGRLSKGKYVIRFRWLALMKFMNI